MFEKKEEVYRTVIDRTGDGVIDGDDAADDNEM